MFAPPTAIYTHGPGLIFYKTNKVHSFIEIYKEMTEIQPASKL